MKTRTAILIIGIAILVGAAALQSGKETYTAPVAESPVATSTATTTAVTAPAEATSTAPTKVERKKTEWPDTEEITPESVIQITNFFRDLIDLPVLKENSKLVRIANERADDMVKNNYFAHERPGDAPRDYAFLKLVREEGFDIGTKAQDYEDGTYTAGENLARGFDTLNDMQVAWHKSTTHTANIYKEAYTEVGVAVRDTKDHGKLVVVIFGGKK